jgi:ribonuclease Z
MNRRIYLIAIGALLVIAVGLWWAARSDRATWLLLERGLAEVATRDALGDLPDGIHVLLCGAGGPLWDDGRSGPCVAVQAGKHLYIVDAGTNGARNVQRFGVGLGRVEAVLITHAHSDHIDGLGELGVLRWTAGNHAEPLPVHGPPVVQGVVAGFNLAYRADMGYRVAHHGEAVVPASGGGLSAVPFPLPADGETVEVINTEDGVRIAAFRVSHEPVGQAVGYRIDYRDRSIAISGDTAKSANLIRHAQGVDLLLHEALSARLTGRIATALDGVGMAGGAKVMRDVPSYHSTPVEAAESAAEARAGALLLYHIIPPLRFGSMESVFMRGVAEAFDGPVTLASDGTLVSLPADE